MRPKETDKVPGGASNDATDRANKESRNHRRLLRLFERDGDWCVWCGDPLKTHRQLLAMRAVGRDSRSWKEATVDHLVMRRDGGIGLGLENLVAACGTCNVARGENPERFPIHPPYQGKRKAPVTAKGITKTAPRGPDHDRVISKIAWKRSPEKPTKSGLFLVTKPGTWRVRLFPVAMGTAGPVVVQGEKMLPWPDDLWFADLEEALGVVGV